MSLPQSKSDVSAPGKISLPAAVAVAAVFAIFIVIYAISHRTPQAVGSATGGTEEEKWRNSSEGRSGKLAELRGKENSAATTYGWTDQSKGVVRLPIDRAIELTILDLNASRK